MLPQLPPRLPESHKGNFGHALIIAGSRGMSGTAILAGMAALRGGAGWVTVATPASMMPIVAGFEPSYMVAPLPEDAAGRIALTRRQWEEEFAPRLAKATCVACGPGLGQSAGVAKIIKRLYADLPVPLVVDADGLNVLAADADILTRPTKGPRILTPHPGEFRRLVGQPDLATGEAMEAEAIVAAKRWNVTLILKGHRSLITDGDRSERNATGNPGMATGGTGDVLTGIVAALVCQGLSPFDAAQLAAHAHGLAGDLAANERGQVGMIASDLIDQLPRAFERLG